VQTASSVFEIMNWSRRYPGFDYSPVFSGSFLSTPIIYS